MNPDRLSSMMTPVSELLCMDVKMSTILRDSGAVHRKEMPFFLSLLEDVINRWYVAIGKMNPGIYSSYHHDVGLVMALRASFDKFNRCDDEGTFLIRRDLYYLAQDLVEVFDKMANVFSGPEQLKVFYHNINSRMLGTLEAIPEGRNGW